MPTYHLSTSLHGWSAADPALEFRPGQGGWWGLELDLPAGTLSAKVTRDGSWDTNWGLFPYPARGTAGMGAPTAPAEQLLAWHRCLRRDGRIGKFLFLHRPGFPAVDVPLQVPEAGRWRVDWHPESRVLRLHSDLASPVGGRFERLGVFHLGTGHSVEPMVYLPEGYDAAPLARHPVVYFHDGDEMLSEGWHLPAETLASHGVLPSAIQVFVPVPHGRDGAPRRPFYLGIDGCEPWRRAFVRTLAQVIVPAVDQRYRTDARRVARVQAGHSNGADFAREMVLSHPEVFGACLMFSAGRGLAEDPRLAGLAEDKIAPRFYLDYAEDEVFGPFFTLRNAAAEIVLRRHDIPHVVTFRRGDTHDRAPTTARLFAALSFGLAGV